ncbi:hypothetical protein [Streptomyces sp. NPDC018693]|uniref:hypothetical protein n=1 Tax=unclassified Streptomyces TaxID=2593676 RepID=UPI0037AD73DE
MSTAVIIALIVAAVAIVAVAALMAVRARGGSRGGRNLKQRFGPEYDRAVARHDGDTRAAERELGSLVDSYGGLRERPLEPAERDRFETRWTTVQERFVESPRDAVTEADRLLAEAAGARGFPDGGRYEEQVDALSVHHAEHVNGYRRLHRAAHAGAGGATGTEGTGTEDMRSALIEARALFEDLVGPARQETGGRHRAPAGRGRDTGTARTGHRPGLFHRHHPKHG